MNRLNEFILVSLFSVFALQVNAGQIVIKNETSLDGFAFFYWDGFNDSKNSISSHFKVPNTSRYLIPTEIPLVIIFTSEGLSGHPVLLMPGDTCEVLLTNGIFSFKGNRSKGDLNILNSMEQKYGYVLPDYPGLRLTSKLNIMYIAQELEKKYQSRKEFVEEYKKYQPLSKKYERVIADAIYQKYLISLLFPFYSRQDSKDFDFNKIPDEYLLTLKKHTDTNFNDSLLYLQHYQLFLWNYCKYLSKDFLNKESEFENMFLNARNNFTGKSREFAMFLILKKYAGKGLEKYNANVDVFLSDYSVSEFRDYLIHLTSEYQTREMKKASNDTLVTFDNKRISWAKILNSSKGKVIYIDLWASWCGPCIQEMPNSDRLRNMFHQNNIEFVYISIDTDINKWRKAVEKLKQPTGNHFLFTQNSQLSKAFGVKSVPQYVIINKDGEIVALNGSRPSDSGLIDMLKNLL